MADLSKFVLEPVGVPRPQQAVPSPSEPQEGFLQSVAGGVSDFAKAQGEKFTDSAFLIGLANSIGQGVTFGTLDEAIGAVASLGGYDYKEVRDAVRSNLDEFRDENAAYAYGSEIAASFLTPMGLAKTVSSLGGKALANFAAKQAAKRPVTAAAVGGGVYGAGTAEEMSDVPMAVVTGAGLGAGLGTIKPAIGTAQKALQRAGVPLTIGQAMGGSAKRIEEALTSVPILGGGVAKAQRRAMEAFTPVSINRALKPLGETVSTKVSPRTAMRQAKRIFDDAFEDVLDDVKIVFDDSVLDLMSKAVSNAKRKLGKVGRDEAEDLETLVLDKIIDATEDGMLTGRSFKTIQSELSTLEAQAVKNQNYKLAEAYSLVEESLIDAFSKFAPKGKADKLKKINRAYSNFIPLRRAAAMSDDSMITPARGLQAVRAEERKLGATGVGRLARGEARMQRPMELGKEIIGREVPDSGTAFRTAVQGIGGTLGAGIVGAGAGELAASAPSAGGILGLGAGLTLATLGRGAYTPAGQRFLKQVGVPAARVAAGAPATSGLLAEQYAPNIQDFLLGQ